MQIFLNVRFVVYIDNVLPFFQRLFHIEQYDLCCCTFAKGFRNMFCISKPELYINCMRFGINFHKKL